MLADPHGDLAYADRPAQGAVLQAARQLPIPAGTDYVTELNLAAPAWLAALAASLTQGAILLLDYGFPAHEYYHPQRQRHPDVPLPPSRPRLIISSHPANPRTEL